MSWDKQSVKGIEKFIDPSRLDIELIPDIDDDSIGKILSVNEDFEPVWVNSYDDSGLRIEINLTKDKLQIVAQDLNNYKDEMTEYNSAFAAQIEFELGRISASITDVESIVTTNKDIFDRYVDDNSNIIADIYRLLEMSNTAIDILQERINIFVETRDVVGAYICGNNDTPTSKWCNIIDPLKWANLVNFLYEQNSGWVLVDSEKLDCRLMFSGNQTITIDNLFGQQNAYARFTVEAWVEPFDSVESTIMDYLYLYDESGYVRITSPNIDIRTTATISTHTMNHVVFAVDSSARIFNIYINGEKIDTLDTVYSDEMLIPNTSTFFNMYEGYVSSFKIYDYKLDEATIRSNFDSGYLGFDYSKHRIIGAFEGRSAESVYTNYEYTKSAISLLKESISLKVSETTFNDTISNLTADIVVMKDSIMLSVSESYTTIDDFTTTTKTLSSMITQTSTDITNTFTTITNGITDDLQSYKEEVATNIRFSASGIEIGKTNSPFKAKLDNTKLSFTQDDVEVAYISNNKLYITEGEITDNLKINNFVWQPRSNGNMSIRYIG